MKENGTEYKSNVLLQFGKETEFPGCIRIEFTPGMEKPGFSQLSQTPGEFFFESSAGKAGVLKVSLGVAECIKAESFRVAASSAVKWLRANHISNAFVPYPCVQDKSGEVVGPITEGAILGDYRFSTYKSKNGETGQLTLIFDSNSFMEYESELEKSRVIAEAVCLARDWSHEPANVINPITLAERAFQAAQAHHLKISVFDDHQLEAMGAGAILAVGKGSTTPSRMIVLEYPGLDHTSTDAPVVLVGKALTFDTGGYSIKNTDAIKGMKYDKCGGIDVIAALTAASELHLKQRVIGIVGAAENSISGGAYKPDDILKTLDGKTVEIISTDAEGRLVLADCLSYAQKEYHPKSIIDLATLTGGIVVALGHVRGGLFSNNDELAKAILQSGEKTNERLWRLPLDEDYLAIIKGDDADLKNAGSREAHSITAAKFLQQFVADKTPWVHLDIAGMADTAKELPYCPKGATGFGVRLLLDYLANLE